ncbi:glycosyltransferase [Dietzia sp. 111N12-1]|uniref:glycosyltransferase n=1 Tax=Dietzia sp. 111N12-1 TaxID=1785156 RepID=UPI0009ECDBD4|nr:glycosyltransferase [Dietzia sp. 111N12-1]
MAKIAHITTVHPLSDPRILRKECRSLAKAGHDVTLIGPGQNRDEEVPVEKGVRIVKTAYSSSRLGRALMGSVRVWRELATLSPRLVHAHDPELLPLLLVWKLLHRRSVVVYDAHESLVGQIEGKDYIPVLLRPVARAISWLALELVTRSIDGVVAATKHIEEGIPAQRTCVVQNFPWKSSFPEVERDNDTEGYFCYVGGVTKLRGIDEMVQAMEIANTGRKLVVVGQADEGAVKTMESAKEVVVYKGAVDSSEIPAILRGAIGGFVVLHPVSNYKTSQPTKLFEYMASGIPFIASEFRSWIELLGDIDAGHFVNPLDVEEIAQAILAIVDPRADAASMGARGRRAFETRFSFDSQSRVLNDFTSMLLERQRRSGGARIQ